MRTTPKSKVQSPKPQRLLAAPFTTRLTPLSAFTLIEIMVVVAIMAIVIVTSIPFIRSGLRKEALNQAIRDVEEVCYNARRSAILQGKMAEVIFHPKDRTFQVSGASATTADNEAASPDASTAPPANSGQSGRIPDSLMVDMLDVNLAEYKDSDEARVRFYPNGTSDELTVILHNEKGEYFKIALEATTGLPTFETNPSKFK